MQYFSFVKRPSIPLGDGYIEQPVEQERLFCLDIIPSFLDERSDWIEIHLFYNWSCKIIYKSIGRFFWDFKKKLVGINLSGPFVSLLPYLTALPLILCNFLSEPMCTCSDNDIFCDITFEMLKKIRKIVMPRLLCKKLLQWLAMLWYEKMGKKEQNNCLYVKLYFWFNWHMAITCAFILGNVSHGCFL